jgi:hypothetical protein
MTETHLIIRQRTREDALASASRLQAKHGRGLIFITKDPGGGDFAPYAVCSFGGYYDRKA